jgi:ankyrin repeat protein
LHYACDSGFLPLVIVLCQQGELPSARDNENRTPVHYAAQKGHLEIVDWFVNSYEGGVLLLKAANKRGNNCLHLAAIIGHLELVKYVLSKGIHIDCQNNAGKTALHLASEKGHIDVVMWLTDHGAKLWV